MIDFDRETWIYLLIISSVLVYFLWNKNRTSKLKKNRKNNDFRMRYLERKRKE